MLTISNTILNSYKVKFKTPIFSFFTNPQVSISFYVEFINLHFIHHDTLKIRKINVHQKVIVFYK